MRMDLVEMHEDKYTGSCSYCEYNCGADIVEEEPCKTCLDFDGMAREKPMWTMRGEGA